jgi:hypothetical protein
MRQETYCSEACLEAAAPTHRLWCTHGDPAHPYSVLDELWRELHPPPETMGIALVVKLCALLADADDAAAAALLARVHTLCSAAAHGPFRHKLLAPAFAGQIALLREGVAGVFAGHPNTARLEQHVRCRLS